MYDPGPGVAASSDPLRGADLGRPIENADAENLCGMPGEYDSGPGVDSGGRLLGAAVDARPKEMAADRCFISRPGA